MVVDGFFDIKYFLLHGGNKKNLYKLFNNKRLFIEKLLPISWKKNIERSRKKLSSLKGIKSFIDNKIIFQFFLLYSRFPALNKTTTKRYNNALLLLLLFVNLASFPIFVLFSFVPIHSHRYLFLKSSICAIVNSVILFIFSTTSRCDMSCKLLLT